MSQSAIETRIAESLASIDEAHGAVVPGIHPATTFERDASHQLIGEHIYRRNSSPTVAAAERVMGDIDGGEEALCFSSGMAAVAAVFATLPRGSRVVAPSVMYHGARDWMLRLHERGDIAVSFFDASQAGDLERGVSEGVDLVWIETPTNPEWDVIDISEASQAARAAGARLVVDSTVAPPVTTRPLELGADMVFHSATKYINGHSDVTAGVLVTAQADAAWRRIADVRVGHGSVLSPFDAWLMLRGLRTLGVRYKRASDSALRIAQQLESNPGVDRVLYPGLPTHPGHEIAKRQMTGGFGGMMSLLVAGGHDAARSLSVGTNLFTTATSLGGTESLIEHRYAVEGPNSHVAENLVRLSIGLEDPEDLIADLETTLEGSS